MKPDFGKTASDYARYRAGFPDELFTRLEKFDIGVPGQQLLDIGTGTGVLARRFAQRGCHATGIDPSSALTAEAEELDQQAGVTVQYVQGTAESTGLPSDTFDAATAAVCWHWFEPDRAAQEIRRILVPNGRLAIVHYDWLPHRGNVADETVALMDRHSRGGQPRVLAVRAAMAALARVRPAWVRGVDQGVYADRLATLAANGFEDLESFSFDVLVPYDHESWRGRIRTHAKIGATQSPARVAQFDRELADLLKDRFPEPLSVPHRVFVVVGRAG